MLRRALVLAIAAVALTPPLAAQVTVPTDPEPPPTTTQTTVRPTTTLPAATTAPPTTRRTATTVRRSTTSSVATTSTTGVPATLPPPPVQPDVPGPDTTPIGEAEMSPVFIVLSAAGFVIFFGMLATQWFLTRPGRQGGTL